MKPAPVRQAASVRSKGPSRELPANKFECRQLAAASLERDHRQPTNLDFAPEARSISLCAQTSLARRTLGQSNPIEEVAGLLDRGLLTKEEFDSQKSLLLEIDA